MRWVYLFQLTLVRGKSSECHPAYQAAETREEAEALAGVEELEP